MNGIRAVGHPDAHAFLRRAEGWLMLREDENNLTLSVAGALSDVPPLDGGEGYLFATVEEDGGVVGVMAERYGSLPGVRGPAEAARAVAGAWGRLKGVAVRAPSPAPLPTSGTGGWSGAPSGCRRTAGTRCAWPWSR